MPMEKKDFDETTERPASLTVKKDDPVVHVDKMPEPDRSDDPPSLYVSKDDTVVHVDAPPTGK